MMRAEVNSVGKGKFYYLARIFRVRTTRQKVNLFTEGGVCPAKGAKESAEFESRVELS